MLEYGVRVLVDSELSLMDHYIPGRDVQEDLITGSYTRMSMSDKEFSCCITSETLLVV